MATSTFKAAFKAASLDGANAIIAELEQRLERELDRATVRNAELDNARCLASERAGAITALESLVTAQRLRAGDLERKLAHAEHLVLR